MLATVQLKLVLAATQAQTNSTVAFLLWLIAAALVIYGIVRIVQGALLQGIVLIVVGLLVGPGGVSIFT